MSLEYAEVPPWEVDPQLLAAAQQALELVREELELPRLVIVWVRVDEGSAAAFVMPNLAPDRIFVDPRFIGPWIVADTIAHEGWHLHSAGQGPLASASAREWGARFFAESFVERHKGRLTWPKEPGP